MGEAKAEEAKSEAPKDEKKEEKTEEKKEEKSQEEEKKEEKAEEKKEEKIEEKKEEKAEEKEEKGENNPPSPIVLYVDLHCVGCAKKIERSIMKVRGVEDVTMDMDQNQVTVKGIVDLQALCSRIRKRTKREVKVLSPLPPEGDPAKLETVASQVSGLTTVVLHVNMHCEACALQLKKKILKMRGVQTAETELSSGKVTVTGTMDATKLADYVYRRTRKQAQIVPQPVEEKSEEKKTEESQKEDEKAPEVTEKTEEKKEEKGEEKPKEEESKQEEGGKEENATGGEEPKKVEEININEELLKRMMYWPPPYVIERVPAPQLFSDENPNACCIS